MGLLQNLFNPKGSASYHPSDPAYATLFGTRPTASGQNVTSDTALRVSAVYACVTVLSQTLAMLPLGMYRNRDDGGKDPATNHPLNRVLKVRPNKWQSSYEWRQMMEAHRLLRGNAYSEIVGRGGRGIDELVPLHPDRVTPFAYFPDGPAYSLSEFSAIPDGAQIAYRYTDPNGQQRIILASEMFHLRGHTVNGVVGINPIALHRESVGLAMATEQHGATLFSNGARMGGILTTPQRWKDPTAKAAFEREFDAKFTGENAHRTLALEEGMKWQAVTMTSEDAQFLDTRKYQVEDIARIFNVPLVLIGHSGDKNATYASAEQFFTSFTVHTVTPVVTNWEGTIARCLIPENDQQRFFAKFTLAGMLRGDMASRAEFYREMFAVGAFSPNMILALEDQNPVEGGDRRFVPLNMVPIDKIDEAIAGRTKTPDTGGES